MGGKRKMIVCVDIVFGDRIGNDAWQSNNTNAGDRREVIASIEYEETNRNDSGVER